jgi:hypothetical protein
MRDPNTFTEVELSLLRSQLGPLINECFLRQVDCFLEDERWAPTILRLQNNSPFVTALIQQMAKLPRFMRIAKEFIIDEPGEIDRLEKLRVLDEINDIKEFTYRWEEQLEEHRSRNASLLNLHELPCSVWSLQLILNRILVALDPLADEAHLLEEETMDLADKIMEWWAASSLQPLERPDRLPTYPIITAQMTIATRHEWRYAIEGQPGYVNVDRDVIGRKVFEDYMATMKAKAATRKVSEDAADDIKQILTAFLHSMYT